MNVTSDPLKTNCYKSLSAALAVNPSNKIGQIKYPTRGVFSLTPTLKQMCKNCFGTLPNSCVDLYAPHLPDVCFPPPLPSLILIPRAPVIRVLIPWSCADGAQRGDGVTLWPSYATERTVEFLMAAAAFFVSAKCHIFQNTSHGTEAHEPANLLMT